MYFSESRLKRDILTFSWRKYNYCFKGVEGRRVGSDGRRNCTILDMKKVEIQCIHQKNGRTFRETEVAP